MMQQQSNSIAFLRQIPYMNQWTNKDVMKIYNNREEHRAENRGQIIAREGDLSAKMFIILEGEVEIVKTNMAKIHFNPETGVLGIAEEVTNSWFAKRVIRSEMVRKMEDEGV